MKNSIHFRWRLFAIALTLVLLGAAVIQRQAISSLQKTNQARLAQNQDGQTPTLSRQGETPLPMAPEAEEIERLRVENKDLHKLRNEVAQLRKQKPELERALAENQRLRQTKQSREQLSRFSELPGFISKASWANAGFASPEATTQTYFWGLREGQFARVLDCLVPAVQQSMGATFRNPSDEQRQEITGFVSALNGIRIADKTVVSNDEVVLAVQAAIFGDRTMKLPLKRFGNEWKISGEPRE